MSGLPSAPPDEEPPMSGLRNLGLAHCTSCGAIRTCGDYWRAVAAELEEERMARPKDDGR